MTCCEPEIPLRRRGNVQEVDGAKNQVDLRVPPAQRALEAAPVGRIGADGADFVEGNLAAELDPEAAAHSGRRIFGPGKVELVSGARA